ncbi:hypothetical protein [Scopulibacillus cellulosilyticus]|uniref:Uncharacterized protein n=1 Tax=Scopulibacillus cellulosilyticus TaxID=2665665 RepID=A0ABW2PY89_9BACL
MAENDKKNLSKDNEKRKKYNFDVDRMVDEGLAGGTVDQRYNNPPVDESRPVEKEEKPRNT